MKSTIIALVILFFFLQCGCQAQTQKAADPFLWDFGKAKEGEVLKHDFVFKNESGTTLNIQGVNTSCGCTVSRVGKKVLLPQESTSIEVKFDTKGYSGSVEQYIYVHTDSPQDPVLRFIVKAKISKEE